MKAELAGICFLKQALENNIRRLDQKQAIGKLMWQIIHNFRSSERLDLALFHIENLVTRIPVYEFENLPIPESVAMFWKVLEDGGDKHALAKALTDQYDVTEQEAPNVFQSLFCHYKQLDTHIINKV